MSVFSLVEWSDEDEIKCIGTATAISSEHVLTTWNNAYKQERYKLFGKYRTKNFFVRRVVCLLPPNCDTEVGEFKESDIISLIVVASDENENWCVLRRKSGTFSMFYPLCRENELPCVRHDAFIFDCLHHFEYGTTSVRLEKIEWYHAADDNPKKRKMMKEKSDSTVCIDVEKEGSRKKARSIDEKESQDLSQVDAEKTEVHRQSQLPVSKESEKCKESATETTYPHSQNRSSVSTIAPVDSATTAAGVATREAIKDAVRVTNCDKRDDGLSSGCALVSANHKLFAMCMESHHKVLCRLPKFMDWYDNPYAMENSSEDEESETEQEECVEG